MEFARYRVIIIDEISMVSSVSSQFIADINDRLNEMKETGMHGDITFGGCHVVWCGDFYQLSPVGQSALYKTNANNANAGVGRTLWLQGITHSVFLSESVRQEGDGKLQELLESVRDGSLEEQLHVLNGRVLSSTCGPEPDMNVTTVTVTDSNRQT